MRLALPKKREIVTHSREPEKFLKELFQRQQQNTGKPEAKKTEMVTILRKMEKIKQQAGLSVKETYLTRLPEKQSS